MKDAVFDVDAVCPCDRFKLVKQLRWHNTAVRFSYIPSNFIAEYKTTTPKTSGKAILWHYITQRASFYDVHSVIQLF